MIALDRVTIIRDERPLLSDVSLEIPSDRRVALLGASKGEVITLMHCFGGLLPPLRGRFIRQARVSFPVGFLGGFLQRLTVRQNVAHLARLYDTDEETIVRFVERAVRLGPQFDKPYSFLSQDVRRHLSRVVAFTIHFDVYLLMQEIAPPRSKRRDAAYELFEARRRTAGMIIPTDNLKSARALCEMALVIEEGRMHLLENFDEAGELLAAAKKRPREKRHPDASEGEQQAEAEVDADAE